MKRILILGASMLLLLSTILLMLPSNTAHHVAEQAINFKHQGISTHAPSNSNIITQQGTMTARELNFESTLSSRQRTITGPQITSGTVRSIASSRNQSIHTTASRSLGHHNANTWGNSTTSHTGILTTLKQNSLSVLQVQDQGQNSGQSTYSNSAVAVNTNFPTMNLIAQATSGKTTGLMDLSDAPTIMNSGCITASHPGDPVTPLGQGTILLLFGVGFMGLKFIAKKM